MRRTIQAAAARSDKSRHERAGRAVVLQHLIADLTAHVQVPVRPEGQAPSAIEAAAPDRDEGIDIGSGGRVVADDVVGPMPRDIQQPVRPDDRRVWVGEFRTAEVLQQRACWSAEPIQPFAGEVRRRNDQVVLEMGSVGVGRAGQNVERQSCVAGGVAVRNAGRIARNGFDCPVAPVDRPRGDRDALGIGRGQVQRVGSTASDGARAGDRQCRRGDATGGAELKRADVDRSDITEIAALIDRRGVCSRASVDRQAARLQRVRQRWPAVVRQQVETRRDVLLIAANPAAAPRGVADQVVAETGDGSGGL